MICFRFCFGDSNTDKEQHKSPPPRQQSTQLLTPPSTTEDGATSSMNDTNELPLVGNVTLTTTISGSMEAQVDENEQMQEHEPVTETETNILSLACDEDRLHHDHHQAAESVQMTPRASVMSEAKRFAHLLSDALENENYSRDFSGRLTNTALKVLFEPLGVDGMENICKSLINNTTIETFELGINQITTTSHTQLPNLMHLISNNKVIKSISIWGNSLDNEAATQIAQALKQNNTLTSLNLNNNQIGDEGLLQIAHALKENTSMKTIDISGNNMITDDSSVSFVSMLQFNQSLSTIILNNNSIGTKTAIKFAQLIESGKNQTLTKIDLSSNLIADQGIISLADSVVKSSNITHLDLHGNMIGMNAREHVQNILQQYQQQQQQQTQNPNLVIILDSDEDHESDNEDSRNNHMSNNNNNNNNNNNSYNQNDNNNSIFEDNC